MADTNPKSKAQKSFDELLAILDDRVGSLLRRPRYADQDSAAALLAAMRVVRWKLRQTMLERGMTEEQLDEIERMVDPVVVVPAKPGIILTDAGGRPRGTQ